MIVGAEGKCMERVGWRTGSEEMKADEVTREMQKKVPARDGCAAEQQIQHQEPRHPGRQWPVALDPTMKQRDGERANRRIMDGRRKDVVRW